VPIVKWQMSFGTEEFFLRESAIFARQHILLSVKFTTILERPFFSEENDVFEAFKK
jgi:hypothetical protein